jgi:hypothetical protein
MKIELTTIVPIVVLTGGIIFTYGQLTSEVEALGDKVDNWKEYNDSSIIAFANSNFQSIQLMEIKVRMAESMFSEYNRSQVMQQKGGI